MIHPSGWYILMGAIFFWFSSWWTHRSLRLWWQQHLSMSNLLLPPLFLLPRSWIMIFVFHWNSWHTFQACNQVFFHLNPLCSYNFFHSPSFIFKIFHASRIEMGVWNNIEKKFHHIHLGVIYSLNVKFKWNSVFFLYLQDSPVSLYRIFINDNWYVKMWQMVLLLWRNKNEKCNFSEIAVRLNKQ